MANPQNIELKIGVALALIERGDSLLVLSGKPANQKTDPTDAERDYIEAVQILEALKQKGEIEGTDVETLDKTQAKLHTLRTTNQAKASASASARP